MHFLRLSLLLATTTHALFFDSTEEYCRKHGDTLTLDNDKTYQDNFWMYVIEGYTYLDGWDRLPDEGEPLPGPGQCEVSYIQHASVKEQLETLVTKLADGTAYRTNNLGLFSINRLPFLCEPPSFWNWLGFPQDTPYSDGYCGIALGMSAADHEIVRSGLDQLIGTGLDALESTTQGPRWTYEDLLSDAQDFWQGRDVSVISEDAALFALMVVHKYILGMEWGETEAREFYDKASPMIVPNGVFPTFLAKLTSLFSLKDWKNYRRGLTDQYMAALRGLIDDNELDLDDTGKNVELLATALFDVFMFAAMPSMSGLAKVSSVALLNSSWCRSFPLVQSHTHT